ncbi:MAG: DUF11 domain-containing protein [Croceibacterium sp.]
MADIDLTAQGSTTTIDGVIFTDADNIGSGTGNYSPFLAIRDNDGNEAGFNTDTNTNVASNPDIDNSKTHSVLLANLPITVVNGIEYFEIRLDINESNSDNFVSLNQFKLYAGDNDLDPTAGTDLVDTLAELQSLDLVYDMDAGTDRTLQLNEVSTGSGTDDYSILVPISLFAGYDLSSTYVFLYAEMGTKSSTFDAESGFEEFNIQDAGTLTGVKFSDVDSDGVRDGGEVGVGGVTVFIDADQDGVLDTNERSTTTAADGSYSFTGVALGTWQVREILPTGSTRTTGDFETATIATLGQVVLVDPIGNHYPIPHISIDKAFVNVTDGPDAGTSTTVIDGAGDTANYTINVTNDGETNLVNVTVTDAAASSLTELVGGDGFNTGDADKDDILDVGEVWHWTATQLANQADLDTNGGGDGDKDNSATVVGTQQGTATEVTATDTAAAPIVRAPAIAIVKTFNGWSGGDGDSVGDTAGDVASYTIVVTNTGNVTLTNVVVQDPLTGTVFNVGTLTPGGSSAPLVENYTLTQADLDSQGTSEFNSFLSGSIENTATATSGQTGPASASAVAPIVYNPEIAIDKTFVGWADGGANGNAAGDVANYTVTVTNTGNVTLTNVTVVDPLTGQNITGVTLAPGASQTYNTSYTLTQADLDNNGGGDGDIDNTATADSDQTGPEDDSAVAPIAPAPSIDVTKVFTGWADGGAQGNQAGDVANYEIVVTNTGNVTLTNVTVKDPLTGQDVLIASLAPQGTATYQASYTITQADLDTKGDSALGNVGEDGDIDNTVTADSDQTGPDTATAEAPLAYTPGVDIEKLVSKTGGADLANYIDADTAAAGYQNVGVQQDMYFAITATNTGNITLTDVVITDTSTAYGGATKTLFTGGALTADATALGATLSGDTDSDGKLDVGETWTILYKQGFEIGQHVNTADIHTGQNVQDTDAAHYFGIQPGPGVRTPGFWSNLGSQFWDGIQGNETKSGPTFAEGELLYAVDANNDGFINSVAGDQINDDRPLDGAGLLIGDLDKDGFTDAGEDTLFIGYNDAKNLINASQKTQSGDGVQMLGRDVVATWLNYLAGNPIGTDADANSPAHFLQDAVDWLQTFGDGSGSNTYIDESFDTYSAGHGAVKTNSSHWKSDIVDSEHSAAEMHTALDTYNNTGSGYAMSGDSSFDTMLIVASQSTI